MFGTVVDSDGGGARRRSVSTAEQRRTRPPCEGERESKGGESGGARTSTTVPPPPRAAPDGPMNGDERTRLSSGDRLLPSLVRAASIGDVGRKSFAGGAGREKNGAVLNPHCQRVSLHHQHFMTVDIWLFNMDGGD